MWQNLVTIGAETSEIRRRKKIKRIETSAVKYNGRRPASWRAAIIKTEITLRLLNNYATFACMVYTFFHINCDLFCINITFQQIPRTLYETSE